MRMMPGITIGIGKTICIRSTRVAREFERLSIEDLAKLASLVDLLGGTSIWSGSLRRRHPEVENPPPRKGSPRRCVSPEKTGCPRRYRQPPEDQHSNLAT